MTDPIQEYIRLACEHGECILNGDSKKGNKIHKALMKSINQIRKGTSETREAFYQLLNHNNDSVKIWTSTALLATLEREAVLALETIAQNNKDIFSLTASGTLDCWNKGILTHILDWRQSETAD
ncbi:DUF2019 domain-containing protein [Desertivirga brevis]|uniref:DUF2019 domain-containing protein n=1 Tax=Desertivirga brevis TaxID=2810310 RepID=UPI001A963E63|nr:DUF2019 domain-containing protein [Pedobacter sp. SYSU D00873]